MTAHTLLAYGLRLMVYGLLFHRHHIARPRAGFEEYVIQLAFLFLHDIAFCHLINVVCDEAGAVPYGVPSRTISVF